MEEKINHPRALGSARDLGDALVALKHDTHHAFIHREDIEQAFTDLARELGFSVAHLSDIEAARRADDIEAERPVVRGRVSA